MKGIFMNINFNIIFSFFLPYIYIILSAFLLNSIIFFYLPKAEVDFIKDESLALSYKKYTFYSNLKDINGNDVLNNSKQQTSQSLLKYNLKAIYYTNINSGWLVIEENSGINSYVLSYGEKVDGYTVSKLFRSYVIFEKDKKEYKLEIKELSTYDSINNGTKEEIIVKNNGAIINRDYLNSYISNVDKVWNNIAISEIKNGEAINGFKIDKVNKDSVFWKIGLKEGDIIKAVNNNIVNSYAEAFKIYNDINNINSINISILRNNKVMEMNYEIN